MGCDSSVFDVCSVDYIHRYEGRVYGCRGRATARERDKQKAGQDGEERGPEDAVSVRLSALGGEERSLDSSEACLEVGAHDRLQTSSDAFVVARCISSTCTSGASIGVLVAN